MVIVVPPPQDGETLHDYLQRLPDEVFRQLTEANIAVTEQFMDICKQNFEVQPDPKLEHLLSIIQRLNNFEGLEQSFESLLPTRKELLESLDKEKEAIQNFHKACSLGRLLGSSVGLGSTALGLWLKESPRSSLALDVARIFCFVTLSSSIVEQTFAKRISDDVMTTLWRDQDLSAPIRKWYKEFSELEKAMTDIFPFQITNELVDQFCNSVDVQLASVNVFVTIIQAVGEQNTRYLRNERFIRTLINFSSMPASRDFREWYLFFRQPILLDATRFILEMQTTGSSSGNSTLSLTLNAVEVGARDSPSTSNFGNVGLWASMGLNCVSIFDAVYSLRSSSSSAMVRAIDQLRDHLASEKSKIEIIIEFVRSRRNPSESASTAIPAILADSCRRVLL